MKRTAFKILVAVVFGGLIALACTTEAVLLLETLL
jgi:hypothetical protein